MATDRCRAGCRELRELRSAVSALQAKMQNQEGLLMDLEERVATRDSGAHERLRVVEASMAALRSRIDLVDMMHPEETLEAKNFPKTTKARDARDVESEKLLDAQLEKRLVALEAGTEDAKCLRSDLNRVVSIAKANGSRLQALEAKEEPNSRIFSCVEGAAQVATRAFASLDSSVKSMELQVSSITASLTACGEEQQRQAMELKQLGHQVARLETSGASQVQLQGHLQGQLQDVHQLIHDWTLKQDDFQAAKEEFARQMESTAEQKEALMQGLQDSEAQLEHVVKSMASLRAEFGERHAMLEERLSRSQNRVAQEIGEQRVRTESRLHELEEAVAKEEEVEDAVQRNMEHVENRLRGVSRCLQTLYRKVGLSAREALAVQDVAVVSTESEDVWVGPGFCQLRSPRLNFGRSHI